MTGDITRTQERKGLLCSDVRSLSVTSIVAVYNIKNYNDIRYANPHLSPIPPLSSSSVCGKWASSIVDNKILLKQCGVDAMPLTQLHVQAQLLQ